jgi:hypothetical protein
MAKRKRKKVYFGEKFEHCVMDVKKSNKKYGFTGNPYAICHKAVPGKARARHKRSKRR